MSTKWNSRHLIRSGLAAVSALLAVLFVFWGLKTHAQSSSQVHTPVHMTTDWSTRHLVYSAPSSTALTRRLQAEPRYLNQLAMRKATPAQAQDAQ